MKKLLLTLGGVMMISSPQNAITWNEFWEPFQSETHVHVRGHGGRHHHHDHPVGLTVIVTTIMDVVIVTVTDIVVAIIMVDIITIMIIITMISSN